VLGAGGFSVFWSARIDNRPQQPHSKWMRNNAELLSSNPVRRQTKMMAPEGETILHPCRSFPAFPEDRERSHQGHRQNEPPTPPVASELRLRLDQSTSVPPINSAGVQSTGGSNSVRKIGRTLLSEVACGRQIHNRSPTGLPLKCWNCTPCFRVRHWRTIKAMEIKETSIFTRRIQRILDDEAYRLLQLHLVHRPDAGDLVPTSGGIRKIRWAPTATGKRGGARIVYYWAVDADTILMLFAFAKNERADLSRKQLRELAAIVREEFT